MAAVFRKLNMFLPFGAALADDCSHKDTYHHMKVLHTEKKPALDFNAPNNDQAYIQSIDDAICEKLATPTYTETLAQFHLETLQEIKHTTTAKSKPRTALTTEFSQKPTNKRANTTGKPKTKSSRLDKRKINEMIFKTNTQSTMKQARNSLPSRCPCFSIKNF